MCPVGRLNLERGHLPLQQIWEEEHETVLRHQLIPSKNRSNNSEDEHA